MGGWVLHDRNVIPAFGDCPSCKGKGKFTYDDWRTMRLRNDDGSITELGKINFGHVHFCWRCDGWGRVETHRYTRGISLTPLTS